MVGFLGSLVEDVEIFDSFFQYVNVGLIMFCYVNR